VRERRRTHQVKSTMRDLLHHALESAGPAALLAAVTALAASVLFLRLRNFLYDALALAVTEAGLLLLAVGIAAGVVATRLASGAWWTWNPRLTAGLVCWLLYAAYLMLRHAVEEPTQRATVAAVVSIFAFFDLPIVFIAIQWWCARHPQPPGGPPSGWNGLWSWPLPVMVLAGAALTLVRFRREQHRRELDAQRREAHAL